MFRKFKSLPRAARVGVVVAVLILFGVAASAPQKSQPLPIKHAAETTIQATPDVTTSTITETQPIPFTSTTVNDASLAKGTTKITTVGLNGYKTLTYKITETNGIQTAKDLISQLTTMPAIPQVTSVGTYVAPAPVATPQPTCTSGTYVNSAGDTVCSPEAAPSVPAGATAQCGDGTYSFSQSRSGTCSHHGGVASWLIN